MSDPHPYCHFETLLEKKKEIKISVQAFQMVK
jgi:hypothetical protein